MFTVFLFCAVIAGTIFLFQFVMLLVGFGLEGAELDADVPDDVGAPGDIDFHGGADGINHETGIGDHDSTWLFGVISVRTVVAAVTMFGLVGMAALSAMEAGVMSNIYAIVLAVGGGAMALFGVHFLMQSLYKLSADGKVRTRNAIGRAATVYIPIPARGEGNGKIQIRMQGRLVDLAAITEVANTLPTGSKVRVVGIVAGSTVRVEPLEHSSEKTSSAVAAS